MYISKVYLVHKNTEKVAQEVCFQKKKKKKKKKTVLAEG